MKDHQLIANEQSSPPPARRLAATSGRVIPVVLGLLALLGFLLSFYLTLSHYRNVIPPCYVVSGCESVLISRYAVIAGIPVSLVGTLFFALMFYLAIALGTTNRRFLVRFYEVASSGGVLVALFLFVLQAAVLRAFCSYCLSIELLALLLWAGSFLPLVRKVPVRPDGDAPASITSNSATQIVATSPAGSGTVDVTVTTPGGTSDTSAADQFTYMPAPSVSGLDPNSGPAAGGTSVTITGSDFTDGAGVKFGDTTAADVNVVSDSEITAIFPAGSGTVDVTVTTPGGTSATSSADRFTYVTPPTVTTVSPSSGPTAGGTSVTITSGDFTGHQVSA